MSNYIVNKILNKTNSYYVMAVMFCLLFYVIFEHLFHLTSLIIQYNSAFDYGKYVRKVCKNEFFESETPRFEIADKINQFKLSNEKNKKNYITIILVIAIIVGILISTVFSYIVYNTLLNSAWIFEVIGKEEDAFLKNLTFSDSIWENTKNVMMYVVYVLYNVFIGWLRNLYLLIIRLFIKHVKPSTFLQNVKVVLMIVLIYVVTIAVFVMMPIYVSLKLSNKADISPFNANWKQYIGYIIFFIILVILRFGYNIYRPSSNYAGTYDPLTEYFTSHESSLFTGNNINGYLVYFTFLAMYITSFFILGNVITAYQRSQLPYVDENENNEVIREELKNIPEMYLSNVYGYKEFKNYSEPYVALQNISGIVFTIFIILCVLTVVLICCNRGDKAANNAGIIKYALVIPLMILMIIIITTNNVTEFNTLVNKYILDSPTRLYKEYINIIHKMFNNILKKDYDDMEETHNGFVCKNVANGIILTLYTNVFKNVESISRTGETDGETIDLTPEFRYDRTCEENIPTNFAKDNVYKISYYINSKLLKNNIFYKFDKCSELNYEVIETINSNLNVFSANNLIKIMERVHKDLYSGRSVTSDYISYIKYEIIMKNDVYKYKMLDYMSKLKLQLHESIFNTHYNKTYHTKQTIIYYDSTTKKFYKDDVAVNMNVYEIHAYNNRLVKNLPEATENHIIKKYNSIVSDICDAFSELVYANIYIFTPLYIKASESPSYKYYVENYKESLSQEYTRQLEDYMSRIFDKINVILSTSAAQLKNNKLTKYIITNYNSQQYSADTLYTKNMLEHITPISSDYVTNIEIDKSVKLYDVSLKKFVEVYDKILELHIDINNGNNGNVIFLSKLQTSKGEMQKLIEDFKKYKNNKAFQNNINNIYRNEDNQYNLIYEVDGKVIKIDNNIYEVTLESMKIALLVLLEIEKLYNFVLNRIFTSDDVITKKEYLLTIKTYMNVIRKNVDSMKNDSKNYENMTKYRINVTQFDVSSLNKDLSMNICKNAYKTDTMVYILILNYIVSIILTNLIIL